MTSYAPPLEHLNAKSTFQNCTQKVILVNNNQGRLIKGMLKIFIKPVTSGTQSGKVLLYNLKRDTISHSTHVNPKGPSMASLALLSHTNDTVSPSLSCKY